MNFNDFLESFTDRSDANAEVSLFEQGMIRNPKTGLTLLCLPNWDNDDNSSINYTYIELTDVKEELEEIEEGFFEFIGSTRQEEIDRLSNDYLVSIAESINAYNGSYAVAFEYPKDIETKKHFIEDGYNQYIK